MKRIHLFGCLVLLLLLATEGVLAATACPTITGISPLTATNTNTYPVSITITGTNFMQGAEVWINTCFQPKIPGTVKSVTPTSITATFQLYNAKTGVYTVQVHNPPDPENGAGDTIGLPRALEVYGETSPGTTTTTTTEIATTATTSPEGENSIYFETNPTGAAIYLDGNYVGSSIFTYYTNREGTYDVVAKKSGYEDYEARITILEGRRVHFYGLLTPLASTGTAVTTAVTASGTGIPVSTATTIRKSTLKVPTPLGTDPPLTPESPVDPATALWAAGIALTLVAIRRR